MVTRILPPEFRAKASAEGPCGKRALWRRGDRSLQISPDCQFLWLLKQPMPAAAAYANTGTINRAPNITRLLVFMAFSSLLTSIQRKQLRLRPPVGHYVFDPRNDIGVVT